MFRRRSRLTVLSCLASLVLGSPSTASVGRSLVGIRGSLSADPVYVQNGSDLFSVVASDASTYRALARGESSVRITVSRLVFAGSPDRAELVFAGEAPTTSDFLVLGSRTRMEALTGRRLGDAQQVQEVIAFRASRTPTEVVASIRVGGDTARLSVPLSVLRSEFETGERARFEVNGAALSLDAREFQDPGEDLRALTASFADREGFRRATLALSSILADLDPLALVDPLGASDSCAFPCVMCGASVLGYAISFMALATCVTAIGCVPAVGAHIAAGTSVLANCGQCGVCNDQPAPPGGGGGDDDPQDPGSECPDGYHECEDNHCCADDGGGTCCQCVPVCACGSC